MCGAWFRHTRRALLVLALGLLAPWLGAQDLQPVPALSGRVVDTTGTLDATQREALASQLAAIEQAKGSQVVILLVPSTAPEDIASYANRVGNTWKIGRREVGDGVLLVVALRERKVRIEVAKALEGAIPDLAARQIIDRAITPRFREGDYAGGLQAAVAQLAARIQGEPLPPLPGAERASAGTAERLGLNDLAIFLFVAVPIAAAVARGLFGRKLGALLTGAGAGALAWWLTASLLLAAMAGVIALLFTLLGGVTGLPLGGAGRHGGGFGGGWGGGGGGGFRSGGGGDFGGGGASGDW